MRWQNLGIRVEISYKCTRMKCKMSNSSVSKPTNISISARFPPSSPPSLSLSILWVTYRVVFPPVGHSSSSTGKARVARSSSDHHWSLSLLLCFAVLFLFLSHLNSFSNLFSFSVNSVKLEGQGRLIIVRSPMVTPSTSSPLTILVFSLLCLFDIGPFLNFSLFCHPP